MRSTLRLYLAAIVLVVGEGGAAIAITAMHDRSEQATKASEAAQAASLSATVRAIPIPTGMTACSKTPPGVVCWQGDVSPVTAISAFKRSLEQLGATNVNVVCVAKHICKMWSATAVIRGIYLSASAVPFFDFPPTKARPGIAEMNVFATASP